MYLEAITAVISVISMTGYLSAYGQAPTEGTIIARQQWGQLPQDMSPYDGVIALRDARFIGQVATLNVDGQIFNVIVFDCPGDSETLAWMDENAILGEIGYDLASKHPEIIGRPATLTLLDIQKKEKSQP